MIAALLLAAAPAATPVDRVLACQMITPAGDAIDFSARLGSLLAVLEPAAGTAWPDRRVIGPGAWREKKQLEASYHFAGTPNGIDLKVEGERATLLVGKRLRSGAPRAHGFCVPKAGGAGVGSDLVSPGAGAAVPAFDSARWPDNRCALVTRAGRRAWIGYTLAEGGARVEIKSPETDLVPGTRILVSRNEAVAPRPARFGGDVGLGGTERFFVDQEAKQAVRLIDFDRMGTGAEPAAAICGYASIVRRPAAQ